MRKQKAVKTWIDYLKSHNIHYHTAIDNGTTRITTEYMAEDCPDRYVESCIWFYGDGMEARVYYSALGAEICRTSGHIPELLRLINFCNARVFLNSADGAGDALYAPHMLYTPRLYLTEDGCFDIAITTMIPYDFYELAPLETADYLSMFCPALLDKLSPALFCVLAGQWEVEKAIDVIKKRCMISE